MKIAIIPGCTELKIKVNPTGKVSREEGECKIPWLYAPWPEAEQKGVVEIETQGDSLRALLTEVSNRYKKANVDFDPFEAGTGEILSDYDVSVNGKSYVSLRGGLDTALKAGDEVIIDMVHYAD
jgi:molybdopterin converting factor small subunit